MYNLYNLPSRYDKVNYDVAEKYPVGGGASKTEAGAEGAKPTKPINSFFK